MNKKHYLCRRKKNAVIMKNLLPTYFDRSQVGRTDYFRQLIFLTFASLSILLFGLHLFGSYGLTVKPALACSACYVVASAVAIIAYLLNGPRKLKHIMPAFFVTVMVVQSVRLLVQASMGHHDPMLTTAELDVCRLVAQGLTLKEISITLGKSVSNVSTVRGNIRKKLGLSQDDDLRRFLIVN